MPEPRHIALGLSCLLASLASGHASAAAKKATISLAMFSDASCRNMLVQGDGKKMIVEMDTSKSCFTFSYVDKGGLSVPTSHGNFKCYADRVTYDKYPFSSNCTSDGTFEGKVVKHTNDYPVGTKCQSAPSHEGTIYEKLPSYVYPGSLDCTLVAK